MFQKATPRLDEVEPVSELATDAPEHPSPVSVLDGSVYRDDVIPPVHICNIPKGIIVSISRKCL